MSISRDEALKALDDIFNYCEEIDYSLPENERSGYKMLPDIQKIRKYIIENTRPQGEWIRGECWSEGIGMGENYGQYKICPFCGYKAKEEPRNFCAKCGADMRKEGEAE